MADSLEKAAGAGVYITIDGTKYEITPFSVGDFIALRSYIRSKRIEDFRKSAEGMDATERRMIITDLVSQSISELELNEEIISPEGSIFMLWRLMMRQEPELTLEEVQQKLNETDLEELDAIVGGLNVPEEEAKNLLREEID